ncbi:MAG TPA: hypothetical protein VIK77_02735 [Tissierellaceae bacterium]
MQEKIALIDTDSILYTCFNPNKVLDAWGEPIKENGKFVYVDKTEDEIKASADTIFTQIFERTKCTHYIGFVKGKNTIKRRLDINPTYKQNRTGDKPKFLEFTKQYFIDKWKIYTADDYEVDDYICSLKRMLPNSFICAIDKDLLNIEGTNYNWRKNEWTTTTKDQELYYLAASLITGDTIDGVKGLNRKGIKFVEKLFAGELPENYFPLVLKEYIKEYGVYNGVKEYFKTYFSLKILDELPDKNLESVIPIKVYV